MCQKDHVLLHQLLWKKVSHGRKDNNTVAWKSIAACYMKEFKPTWIFNFEIIEKQDKRNVVISLYIAISL